MRNLPAGTGEEAKEKEVSEKPPNRKLKRNRPPFGGKGMTEKEFKTCHPRWSKKLGPTPGMLPEGSKIRDQYEMGHQCGMCRFYVPLESDLGMDWGVCAQPKSFHDGKVVFEHHTCEFFDNDQKKE